MSLINGGHEDEKEPRNICVGNLQVRTASVTAHAAVHSVTAFCHQASAGQLGSLQLAASKAQMDSLRRKERESVCVRVWKSWHSHKRSYSDMCLTTTHAPHGLSLQCVQNEAVYLRSFHTTEENCVRLFRAKTKQLSLREPGRLQWAFRRGTRHPTGTRKCKCWVCQIGPAGCFWTGIHANNSAFLCQAAAGMLQSSQRAAL